MLDRTLRPRLEALAETFPAVLLTGPRQSGKTTLARRAFPDFAYITLEAIDTRQEAVDDPRGLLRSLANAPGVILDEVQRAPSLMSYLQGVLDSDDRRRWVLTGSQQLQLTDTVSQSLAGRVAILELMPFSVAELSQRPEGSAEDLFAPPPATSPDGVTLEDLLFKGLYPRIHDQALDPVVWLDGYLRTYAERDVRQLLQVGDATAFRRFLGLCAGRTAQVFNANTLASDVGVTQPTIKRWVSVLEASYLLTLVPQHHANFGKRLTRRPKLYWTDVGLVSRLLGITSADQLRTHPLRGPLFETFVATELQKRFLHQGRRPPLSFFRTRDGREVDFIVDLGDRLVPVEVKSGETLASDAFRGLDAYLALSGAEAGVLAHGGARTRPRGVHHVWPWWGCS